MVLIAGLLFAAGAAGADAGQGSVLLAALHPVSICPTLPGGIRCDAMAMANAGGGLAYNRLPVGYGPADLQSAYGVTAAAKTRGSGQTVAIVAATSDPTLVSDLAVYRSTFHLPPCTEASGCLRIVDESGLPETTLPTLGAELGLSLAVDVSGETSLDVDMVSAGCPLCHILVVEAYAQDPTVLVGLVGLPDLAHAANEAARLGADAVSTSYGEPEGFSGTEESIESDLYDTPGTVQLAGSGDGGYGVNAPASSPNVIAVGGTTLNRYPGGRGWTETAWDDAGSGCSSVEPKPSWQTDKLCPNRTTADVSADADPDTGVAIYDTDGAPNGDGWLMIGGTSAASPLVAALIGLAGNGSTMGVGARYIYAHTNDFYNVVSGPSNKKGCGDYTCRPQPGYNGPTGWGSPDGLAGL